MLETIKKLFEQKPLYASRIIRADSEMWEWVTKNCDPRCDHYTTQIYTAITSEKVLCPCGSNKPRKLINYQKGLSFCGRASVCSAAREAVSSGCIAARAVEYATLASSAFKVRCMANSCSTRAMSTLGSLAISMIAERIRSD